MLFRSREGLQLRLSATIARLLERRHQLLKANGEKLHAVSPLATLERGYAIASKQQDGKILLKIDDVQMGESVTIRLTNGFLIGEVQEKQTLP